MKKSIFILLFCILGLALFSQQVTEESVVINVEVPVRVFEGNAFVDNLTIDDFEILENGEPQRVEAVYLVKKRSIERSEEKRRFLPETTRSFFLFFELSEYDPRLGDALSYFIKNAISPEDELTIATPMKTYRLRGKALEVKSHDEIVDQLKGLIRRDTLLGASEYNNIIKSLEELARTLTASILEAIEANEMTQDVEVEEEGYFMRMENLTPGDFKGRSIDEQLQIYQDLLIKMETIRSVDEEQMINFAEYLKDKEGRKFVYMFYQKEFIPQIDPKILNEYMSLYQDRPNIFLTISSLFDLFVRDTEFDVEKVKQAYADSSVSIHFLYITKPSPRGFGVYMREQSEDIFGPFREMAHATGGFTDSSANPDFLFQEAVKASENYYLLYYSPKAYKSDGTFKNITVRVKDKKYRVTHRVGYIAN
jgi:hypothetical protein